MYCHYPRTLSPVYDIISCIQRVCNVLLIIIMPSRIGHYKIYLHVGKVMGMSASSDGLLLCTISDDKSLKVFDVINFGEHIKSNLGSHGCY